jgi:hypothetical protein
MPEKRAYTRIDAREQTADRRTAPDVDRATSGSARGRHEIARAQESRNDYHYWRVLIPAGPTSLTRMSRDPLGLTRGLLNQTAALRHGFLDVLGDSTDPPVPTVAQRAMNSPFFATMYERLWRPTSFYLASGVTARVEQRRAAAALRLSSAENLLDVACGPGNFTGPLAGELPDGSLAV